MPSKRQTTSKKSILDEPQVLDDFDRLDINPKHAQTMWKLFLKGTRDFENVLDFPKAAKKLLRDEYSEMITSKVIKRTDAADGSTTKLLIQLQDGQCVESVIMRYGHVELDTFPAIELEKMHQKYFKFKSNKRATLCVSSQVGCAMGCTFCATGTMNLQGNLTCGEILEQLYHANEIEQIRGVVFMGMGEPLDNYEAVIAAIRAMADTARFGLAHNRISISTVGVVPRMLSLIRDAPQVGLALSLHAPTQQLRTEIVPTAKAWPLHKIIAAMDKFIENQNKDRSAGRQRHVLVEYVMISGVNDTEQVAHELGQLLQHRKVLLNLIPYNPTNVGFDYSSPTEEAKAAFLEILRNSYNVRTLLRQTLGKDIDSACGQLVLSTATSTSTACGSTSTLIALVKILLPLLICYVLY